MPLRRLEFLGTLAAIATNPPLAASGAPGDDLLAPDVVVASLDAVWTTLLDVGPDPFLTSNRADVERRYRDARASVVAPLTPEAAWLTIAPVLGALNDGHVGLGFPDPLNAAPHRFPLRFALSPEDALLVIADRTRTIPLGSRLVSVDGVSAETYRAATLSAFGGQTRSLHRTRVSMAGAWTAIALFGDHPAYVVRYLDAAGVPREATVRVAPPATAGADAGASPSPAASPGREPYAYSTIAEGKIGLIDYRSCEDLERFKTFLAATFAAVKRAPVDALVIDIRKNGGGNSDLNDVLWTYVSTKPFKQFGGTVLKSCDRLKREYGHAKYAEIYGEDVWAAPNGTIVRSNTDPSADLVVPGNIPDRYAGPVYLLISPQSFSSAMSCALAAKDYGLATIVGEETGEPVNSTGEVYNAITPSGLTAHLTTKIFLPPKPHPSLEGVVPDIVVPTTPADIAAGRDPVLDRVLALVSAHSPRS